MIYDKDLKRIVDCLPIPLLILDTEDNIVLYNLRVERWVKDALYALSIQEFLNLYISDTDIPRCLDALKTLKQAILDKQEKSIKIEVTTKQLNKAFYIVLSTASNIILNEQDYILITLEDITLLKSREKQLKITENLLDRSITENARIGNKLARNIHAETEAFKEQQEQFLRIYKRRKLLDEKR